MLPMTGVDLAGMFQVVFVGDKMPGSVGVKWNFKIFNVRKWRILAALNWLIEFNPLYKNVRIDYDELLKYPDDDVPEDIKKGAILMKGHEAVARDHGSYVQDRSVRLDDVAPSVDSSPPESKSSGT